MSKVISFSISDRYLDKIRSLYPDLTDNLAAKQALIDGLDSSLSSSLDDSLDAGLDGKLKSLIESELDGILDERLDDAVGKLISSLSERLSRLEERLDDSLDGRLDAMEQLLKLQREASIATSPIPSSPAIEDEDEDDSLLKLALRLDHLNDQALVDAIESELEESTEIDESEYKMVTSPLPTVVTVETADTVESVDDTVETAYKDEPGKVAIGPVPGDSPHVKTQLCEAVTSEPDSTIEGEDAVEPDSTIETVASAIEKTQSEIARLLGVHNSTVTRWKQNKAIPSEYADRCRFNENKTKILWIS